MEALGVFSDGEWESFAAMFLSEEINQTHIPITNCCSTELHQLPNNGGGGGGSSSSSSSWFYSLDAFVPNLQSYCKQDIRSCSSASVLIPNSSDFFMPVDERNFGSEIFSDVLMEEVDNALAIDADGDDSGMGRFIENSITQCNHPPPSPLLDSAGAGNKPIALKRKVNNRDISDNQKKKTRITLHGQRKKITEEKRRGESVEEERQSSISYNSDQEENGSEEANGGGSGATSDGGVNRKSRASRGSATDPQSLYARKRREKINERLRILQKLVPNGTKVDISTMLEEAVHYVKFLQLQIKLLSSDEMWMFAPLAYNGMDIGLPHNLSPFLSH